MIGNTIKFIYYEKINPGSLKGSERKEATGLVVDAYTEIKGSTSGKFDSFLGCGDGSVSGETKSNRIYKVQYYEEWDAQKSLVRFKDIEAWQLSEIISFANSINQEVNEEKIIEK